MIGTIGQMIRDMEHGVYDFTKDGKCSQCGACCSDLLPISGSEYSRIKRYIKKHNIKEQKHIAPAVLAEPPKLDLTCPFLDMNRKDKKCTIYPVKPLICSCFICSDPNGARNHKELYEEKRKIVGMREVFFAGSDDGK